MKKSVKNIVAATLLCSMFACTNSFALPEWLLKILRSRPIPVDSLKLTKKEVTDLSVWRSTLVNTIRQNTETEKDAVYMFYECYCEKNGISNPISKDKMISHCPEGFLMSKYGTSIFSWIQFSGRYNIVYLTL